MEGQLKSPLKKGPTHFGGTPQCTFCTTEISFSLSSLVTETAVIAVRRKRGGRERIFKGEEESAGGGVVVPMYCAVGAFFDKVTKHERLRIIL